ncbi:hypothetical protein FH972_022064 [Carpinus fangiana]|uniref:ERCC1-like central domain-containing protein n=1 Tax=Carpinus fangiana TaxID=176857 RepID=A0A5N6KRH9_9ROSI|nr:hypothetical protein FH972_022064 [Carpinus fangiana]
MDANAEGDKGQGRPAARFDAPVRQPGASSSSKVQQPTPQVLPTRKTQSSILVSTRQRGNPVVDNIRAMPWEYADIPADFVLGQTTCALFLSLKYHRLHPEYIYSRIRGLQGKYNLRIILTMVDITNHEESIRELTKTSIINHVTVILCWSAAEASRYLELFKSFEGAAPTSIRAHQSTTYSDKLVDFITVPRGINKTDALSLISTFGSLKTAINARPEEVALVAGWGDKKVNRWCNTVREPFRVRKAARRGISKENSRPSISRDPSRAEPDVEVAPAARSQDVALEDSNMADTLDAELPEMDVDEDEEQALLEAGSTIASKASLDSTRKKKKSEVEPSEGIAAALAKYRNGG